MHIPTLRDWFGSSASATDSDNLGLTRSWRNALLLLDHKLYASDYDSDSVASENHCENRPLQAPLFRLSPARPRFSRNFLDALSYLAAWNWLKVL